MRLSLRKRIYTADFTLLQIENQSMYGCGWEASQYSQIADGCRGQHSVSGEILRTRAEKNAKSFQLFLAQSAALRL
jgi:hypothetical protein